MARKTSDLKFLTLFSFLALLILNISPVYALNGQVNIHAGNAFSGFTEGPNGVGRLDLPWGFAKSTNGNIYVANDHFVTEVNSLKTIKIFAGSSSSGDTDASRLSAAFRDLRFIAFDSQGDMYLSDSSNHKIKKIDMVNIDTYDKKNNFFSARRALSLKHDDYGRNISIIMLN